MHIEVTLSSAVKYILAVTTESIPIKFFSSLGVMFVSEIYETNETLIKLIIFIYLLDLALGVAKAIKHRVFSSRAFFKGATKILVYGIFMMIALAVDKSIGLSVMLPLVFGFITTTDAASILENLEQLGYDIPKPLIRLLQVHKNKFFYNKIRETFGGETFIDLDEDFKSFKNTYIPLIKGDERKMFEIKIPILEDFVYRVADIRVSGCDKFKIEFDILFNAAGAELKKAIAETNFSEKKKKSFLSRHFKRADGVVKEINNIIGEGECDGELRKQKKNNVIQALVRIIMKGISDNIKGGKH